MFNAFCSGVNIVSIVPFLGRQSPVARELPHPLSEILEANG